MAPQILAVDDDAEILALLQTALTSEGYDVLMAHSAAEFRALKDQHAIDLFLVDVNLSDGNGFALVKEIRRNSEAGIIMLTGRSSETDHVVGLEIGADDYVTKPFRLREIAARVNAVFRRTVRSTTDGPAPTAPKRSEPTVDYEFGDCRLSLGARMLWGPDGAEIELTTAEFQLLVALLASRGRVLDRDQLMNAVKGRDWESYDRIVDGLVSRLRKKLPTPKSGGQYIRTVHGIGYSFIS
ncbi:MAG: response regulator transcription factor [Pseudomonadota bacterium]